MIVLCIVLPGVAAWWHGARWEGRLGRGKERNVVYDHAVYLSDFSYIYIYNHGWEGKSFVKIQVPPELLCGLSFF